jgi:cytosine/adenosine deaminase-related metal-dependent hydrolase
MTEVINYTGYLITSGFIDAHVHYPQVEIIASYR